MTDLCPTCGTELTMVDAVPNADPGWLAVCELGHIIELEDEHLDVPVRLLGLLLAVLYMLAGYVDVPL